MFKFLYFLKDLKKKSIMIKDKFVSLVTEMHIKSVKTYYSYSLYLLTSFKCAISK